jgi:hypothetical protein
LNLSQWVYSRAEIAAGIIKVVINAQDDRRFKTIFILQPSDKNADNIPHRGFRYPDLLGDAGKCLGKAIIFNITDQTIGCPVLVVNAIATLEEGNPTTTALIAFLSNNIPTPRPCMGISI